MHKKSEQKVNVMEIWKALCMLQDKRGISLMSMYKGTKAHLKLSLSCSSVEYFHITVTFYHCLVKIIS